MQETNLFDRGLADGVDWGQRNRHTFFNKEKLLFIVAYIVNILGLLLFRIWAVLPGTATRLKVDERIKRGGRAPRQELRGKVWRVRQVHLVESVWSLTKWCAFPMGKERWDLSTCML
jgi:hypothetical protein